MEKKRRHSNRDITEELIMNNDPIKHALLSFGGKIALFALGIFGLISLMISITPPI